MKQIIICLFALLSFSTANAQTWDFATVGAADQANLNADSQNWEYDSSNNRWKQQAIITESPLMANGVELNFTKNMKFTTTAADQIRVDAKKGSMTLNNKSAKVFIYNAQAGQSVTIDYQSSNSSTGRTIEATNVTATEGNTPTTDRTTFKGTVTANGTITLQSTGGLYVYKIVVGDGSSSGGEEPAGDDYSVAPSVMKNQAVLTLSDGSQRFYNTADVTAIDIDGTAVTVSQSVGSYTFNNKVTNISFTKGVPIEEGQEGSYTNASGKVQINEAKGWLESAYVKFALFDGAASYNVYVKGGQFNSYTKIDHQLVRNYGSYGRADMVGLMAADYAMKIVPVDADGNELTDAANEVTALLVKNYDRAGYAHFNYQGVGAYNDDGTLKQGAKVFYVTKYTAKTISTEVAGAQTNPCVGIQAIIDAYQKGQDTTPIAFRFIGKISKEDLDAISSSEEGLQIKGKNEDSELNMTFEGIGDDATLYGFGFLVRNAKSVEFRNFASMRCMDDGVSMDTDNSNIWVHHLDVFYGKHGSGDHDKGDGAVDVKSDSKFITVSYCRYWDTGKTNMFGMKNESGPNYISYHHNWFDHSDSRHPRVRTMSVHVWNNYFDNVAKYGVGATSGSSVFVENNYFLKTKKPILSSNQGTDALGSGTFSGEDGGMIKAYGNLFDRTATNFRYYTQNNPASTGYDAYETTSRDEQVPSTEVTRQGGTPYNNFDTNSSLIYSYTPDAANDVPGIVMGYYGAGRMNHGDFSYSFPDCTGNEDTDSAYDPTLGGMLDSYASSFVGFFGDDSGQGGGDQPGGGDDPVVPEGTILASFDGAPSNSMFTVGGDYGDGKITYNGTYYKKGVKFNSNGSITFTPQKNYNMTIVMGTAKGGRNVKINGTQTTVSGTENVEGKYYELDPIAITANTEYVLTKGSAEGLVMLIILEPTE